jgi:hypothetical protein
LILPVIAADEGVTDFPTHSRFIGAELDITIMTAAEPNDKSESWPESGSIGRFCGTMFITAVLKAMWEESEEADDDDDRSSAQAAKAPEDDHTYLAFAEKVYDILYKIDKFREQHDIRFSAQDDDWVSAWADRTDILLSDSKAKWDALADVQPTPSVTAYSNCHRTDEEVQSGSPQGSHRTHGNVASISPQSSLRDHYGGIVLRRVDGPLTRLT